MQNKTKRSSPLQHQHDCHSLHKHITQQSANALRSGTPPPKFLRATIQRKARGAALHNATCSSPISTLSAAVLVQPLASTREDVAWTEAAAQTRRMRARRTSKNELSSFGCNQMPHCRSPRLISILQHEHKRTQAAWQQQRAIVPVQTSAAVFIQSTEALFSTWKLVLQLAFDVLLLALNNPIRAFGLEPPARCVTSIWTCHTCCRRLQAPRSTSVREKGWLLTCR